MNYQIKFTLKVFFYLVHINHFLITEMKYVIRGTVRRENFRSGKCPYGEMSLGELSVWEMSVRGIVRLGNCPSGNFPSGKSLSEYLVSNYS